MGNRITIAVSMAIALLAIWYWFIDEPTDPFAPKREDNILADPKMPPDTDEDNAGRITPDVRSNGESKTPTSKTKMAKPECPPGDPMCGGL